MKKNCNIHIHVSHKHGMVTWIFYSGIAINSLTTKQSFFFPTRGHCILRDREIQLFNFVMLTVLQKMGQSWYIWWIRKTPIGNTESCSWLKLKYMHWMIKPISYTCMLIVKNYKRSVYMYLFKLWNIKIMYLFKLHVLFQLFNTK